MKRILFCLLLVMLLHPASAQSQSNIGLTLYPAINEHVIEAGETARFELIVENNSLAPYALDISAGPLLPFEQITDPEARERFDASSWIQLSEEQIALEPDERSSIIYEVSVPEAAPSGGHYAQITVRPLSLQTQADTSGAQTVPEINAIILFNVPGPVEESLLLDASQLPSQVNRNQVIDIPFTLQNEGTIHVLAHPTITISKSDVEIARFNLTPQIVLPGTDRDFTQQWIAPDTIGTYDISFEVTYGSDAQTVTGSGSLTVSYALWQQILAVTFGVFILLMVIRWRQLPRAFDALRGRSTSLRGSYRRKTHEQTSLDDASYDEVFEQLEQSLPLGLSTREETEKNPVSFEHHPSSELDEDEQDKRSAAKTDELVQQNLPKQASVAETTHDDSKTVVIQTGASTIVREEKIDDTPAVSAPRRINVKSDNVRIESKPSRTQKISIKTSSKPKTKPKKAAKKKSTTSPSKKKK